MERLNTELEEMFVERMENENPDYEPIPDEDFEPAQEVEPTPENEILVKFEL